MDSVTDELKLLYANIQGIQGFILKYCRWEDELRASNKPGVMRDAIDQAATFSESSTISSPPPNPSRHPSSKHDDENIDGDATQDIIYWSRLEGLTKRDTTPRILTSICTLMRMRTTKKGITTTRLIVNTSVCAGLPRGPIT